MHIGILTEGTFGERRVSATPQSVEKMIALGATVLVEVGAGLGASISDEAYVRSGAAVLPRHDLLAKAEVLLCVQGPDPASLLGVRAGTVLIGNLDPARDRTRIEGYAALGIEALAMDFLPRITRAQSMDTLSSQSNLAGYRAVIEAGHAFGRAFPMMMTAAGTISAARIFVMGVGVAGLQAIATARRLGAQVSATDVRSATREQILSLGAKPIFVESVPGIEGEGSGGYADEMSIEYQAAQAALVSGHLAKQDIVITTALIPGRAAPRLISEAQIATMRSGSVVVDLAIDQGGNVEGAVPDQITEQHGVKLVAFRNLPSRLASDASALFARNLLNFLTAFWDRQTARLVLPETDEIVRAVRLTQDHKIICERLLAQPSAG